MSFLNQFLPERPRDDTLASVVRNLAHLLNAKRGYSSPLCEFGLDEFYAQQGAPASAEAVMHQILADIAAYEPRLRPRALVAINDEELPYLFELQGEVLVAAGRPLAKKVKATPCRLAILFDPVHGEVKIEVASVR